MSGLVAGAFPAPVVNTPGTYVVEGSFDCNGVSAPASPRGLGFSVAAPSTGRYTVTLDSIRDGDTAALEVAAEFCSLTQAGGANDVAFVSDTSGLTSGRTFVIETQSAAGTAANLSAGRVNFRLVLVRSIAGQRRA